MRHLKHLQYIDDWLIIFTNNDAASPRPHLKVSDKVIYGCGLWAHNGIVIKNYTSLEINEGDLISPISLNSLYHKKEVSNEKRSFIKTITTK